MEPKIQIEIGCRSLFEPTTVRTLGSLVDEEYAGRDFAASSIRIPTVNPERTFLEKIFLLHEEFHRPLEKMRVNRLSRHLYDIYQLSKTEIVDIALKDSGLYQTIIEHRQKFTRVGGVDYKELKPQTIDFIPITVVLEAWRADYNTMLEQMIYDDDAPSFDNLINELTKLRERIHAVEWMLPQGG